MSAKVSASVFANGGIVASPADRWSFLRRLLPGHWVSLREFGRLCLQMAEEVSGAG